MAIIKVGQIFVEPNGDLLKYEIDDKNHSMYDGIPMTRINDNLSKIGECRILYDEFMKLKIYDKPHATLRQVFLLFENGYVRHGTIYTDPVITDPVYFSMENDPDCEVKIVIEINVCEAIAYGITKELWDLALYVPDNARFVNDTGIFHIDGKYYEMLLKEDDTPFIMHDISSNSVINMTGNDILRTNTNIVDFGPVMHIKQYTCLTKDNMCGYITEVSFNNTNLFIGGNTNYKIIEIEGNLIAGYDDEVITATDFGYYDTYIKISNFNITNDDILSIVTDMKNYEKYIDSNDNHNGCLDERDIHVSEYIDISLHIRELIRKIMINK